MVNFDPERSEEFGLKTAEVEFVRLGLESQLGFTERIPDELDTSDPRQEVYQILQTEMRRLLDEGAVNRVAELRGEAWVPKRLAQVVVEAVEPAMFAGRMEFAALKGMYPHPTRYQRLHIAHYDPSRLQVIGQKITTELTDIES